MRTPKYTEVKQAEYRERCLARIAKRYNTKRLSVVTLAGAHCFGNARSIENVLADTNKGSTLHIPEMDALNVKKILKHLTNVRNVTNSGNMITYYGKYKGCQVVVAVTTLKKYLTHLAGMHIKIDVLIADYFGSLNYAVEEDLDIILENRLMKKNGTIFLTASECPRIRNTPTYLRIISYAGSGKKYCVGMREFLKRKLKKSFKLLSLDQWNYKDNKSSSVMMWVVDLHVTY